MKDNVKYVVNDAHNREEDESAEIEETKYNIPSWQSSRGKLELSNQPSWEDETKSLGSCSCRAGHPCWTTCSDPELIFKILGHEGSEPHESKNIENCGEEVCDVELIGQESLECGQELISLVLLIFLLHQTLLHLFERVRVSLGQSLREEHERNGEYEQQGGNDGESNPPGSDPARIMLLHIIRFHARVHIGLQCLCSEQVTKGWSNQAEDEGET